MKSLEEAFQVVARLRDMCEAAGASQTANRLTSLLTTYWTTTTEALVELLDALEQTQSDWDTRRDSEGRRLAGKLRAKARKLADLK